MTTQQSDDMPMEESEAAEQADAGQAASETPELPEEGPSENTAENAMQQAFEQTDAADALGHGSVAHPKGGQG